MHTYIVMTYSAGLNREVLDEYNTLQECKVAIMQAINNGDLQGTDLADLRIVKQVYYPVTLDLCVDVAPPNTGE